MPVLKRRSRIVSFRLSEEEYDTLKEICIANGARSISDFTRSVACKMVPSDGNEAAARFERALTKLSVKVETLDQEVRRLNHILEIANTATPPTAKTK